MTRLLSLATACAALSLTTVAMAQTPPAPPAGAMGGPGGGGGGLMGLPRTVADVTPWADRLFGRLDANQDGAITGSEMAILTRPEIATRGGGRLRAMISQSDANRDARVSREELEVGAQRMFTRMDADGDGILSDVEMPQQPAPPRPMTMPTPQADPMPMPMDDPGG